MIRLLTILRSNFLDPVSHSVQTGYFQKAKIIAFPAYYHSFDGYIPSAKYIPTETEVVGMYDSRQMSDKNSGVIEVTSLFQKTAQNATINKQKSHSIKIRFWFTLLFILLVFSFAIIHNQYLNREIKQTFQVYFFKPNLTSFLSVEGEIFSENPEWKAICRAFHYNNYTLVQDIVKVLPANSPVYQQALLANSWCLMNEQRFQQALEILTNLHNKQEMSNAVSYFEGLCYLEVCKISAARMMFKSIKGNDIFVKNAGEIIQKIKELD